MKQLNSIEIERINNDIVPFEKFLMKNNLYNDLVQKKYSKIKFHLETRQELKGAKAITYDDCRIGISEEVFKNNNERPRAIFHETGHVIMGLKQNSDDVYNSVLGEIISTQKEYPQELTHHPTIYAYGLDCLEEYLVEKFSQSSCYYAKGISIPQAKSCKNPSISGNYSYYTTLDSNYGIFESICSTLVCKTFGDVTTAIRAGLNEEYFSKFFQMYDKLAIMKILGNLGQVLEAIRTFAGQSRIEDNKYNPNEIEKLIVETNHLVNSLTTLQETKNKNR